jgi:hypothetical protein
MVKILEKRQRWAFTPADGTGIPDGTGGREPAYSLLFDSQNVNGFDDQFYLVARFQTHFLN